MKKLTTEEFITKANRIHKNKYDYSKVNYINSQTKIQITCPIHGEFQQKPNDHLNGKGCPKCTSNKLKTTDQFKQEIIEKFGDKYDLSQVAYKGAFKHVTLICNEEDGLGNKHGEFLITPSNLLKGRGCPKCSKRYRPTTEEWVKECRTVHNNKYDYSKVTYKNNSTKVCIICHEVDEFGKEHGEFWQTPSVHLQMKCGCPKCTNKHTLTKDEFIEKSFKLHKLKYDYSKVNYKSLRDKVKIICPVHGEFEQTAQSHLSGRGCPFCANNVRKTTEQFIDEARKIHGDKYGYDKVCYINNKRKVKIICPIHGVFEQSPLAHLHMAQGCPECYTENKHLSETKVYKQLKEIYPNVEYQKHFQWLGYQSLDFFLPDHNVAIEYQGRQHFSNETFYKQNNSDLLRRDLTKIKLCKEHSVKLYHLTFEEKYIPSDFNHYKLFTDLNEILAKIKNPHK